MRDLIRLLLDNVNRLFEVIMYDKKLSRCFRKGRTEPRGQEKSKISSQLFAHFIAQVYVRIILWSMTSRPQRFGTYMLHANLSSIREKSKVLKQHG